MRGKGGMFGCQEAQFLNVDEFTRLGWEIRHSADRRAALVYDKAWAAQTKTCFTCFDRFVIGVFGNTRPVIIVSAYLPDAHIHASDEASAEIYEQITRAVHGLRATRYPQAALCVLLDANVEIGPGAMLEYNGEEYEATGKEGTHHERRWERHGGGGTQQEERERRRRQKESLLDFMQQHALAAANTFGSRQHTWESWGRTVY